MKCIRLSEGFICTGICWNERIFDKRCIRVRMQSGIIISYHTSKNKSMLISLVHLPPSGHFPFLVPSGSSPAFAYCNMKMSLVFNIFKFNVQH